MLAVALQDQQKCDEAEQLLRDTLATQRRVHGDGHLDTLVTCSDLTTLLTVLSSATENSVLSSTTENITNARRCSDAEELSRGALAQARRTLGPEHPLTLGMARVLGLALSRHQGKAVEAEALLTDTLAMQQRACGPDHPATQRTAQNLQNLQRGDV